MQMVNLHTHSNYCDGSSSLEEYVKKAIDLGNRGIGFSSHAPISLASDWHMDASNFSNYLGEINSLKIKYASQIEIFKGLEIDYLKNTSKMFSSDLKDLDFVIGSVHYLGEHTQVFGIDGTDDEFLGGLTKCFDGQIRELVTSYYLSIIEMVHGPKIDIIGHFDLVKKLNKNNKYFDETASWYKDVVINTLNRLKDEEVIFEVNTRGCYKGFSDEYYPSDWIIRLLIDRDMPITISSDAHQSSELNYEFERVVRKLLGFGLESICILKGGKWTTTELVPIAT